MAYRQYLLRSFFVFTSLVLLPIKTHTSTPQEVNNDLATRAQKILITCQEVYADVLSETQIPPSTFLEKLGSLDHDGDELGMILALEAAVRQNSIIIAHGLARSYLLAKATLVAEGKLPIPSLLSENAADILRKQFFIITGNDVVMKARNLTLSFVELAISRSIPIRNSKIDLSGFYLSSLESFVSVYGHDSVRDGIEQIDLSNNCLTEVPDDMSIFTSLTRLDVSNNKIKHIPESFGQLKKLIRLDVQNNNISSLPESVCELKNLRRLDISENNISCLPTNIGALSHLRWLYLDGNELKEWPEGLEELSSLCKLSITNNKLSSLPSKEFQEQLLVFKHDEMQETQED